MQLSKGRTPGGDRYFLDDEPIHCGDRLELRLPGDPAVATLLRREPVVAALVRGVVEDTRDLVAPHLRRVLAELAATADASWRSVRFELDAGSPVLYLALGGPWETWRPPAGKREGDTIEVTCDQCRGAGRIRVGGCCPACRGAGERAYVQRDRATGVISTPVRSCDACAGSGKALEASTCDDCDGKGRRGREIVRPDAPHALLRPAYPDDFSGWDLRWPQSVRC